MLRGNWQTIRGAATVGLGAPGRHDARLQRLAGRMAPSLAHTLCMSYHFLAALAALYLTLVSE